MAPDTIAQLSRIFTCSGFAFSKLCQQIKVQQAKYVVDPHDNELSHKRSKNSKPTQASVKGSRHSKTSFLPHVSFEILCSLMSARKKVMIFLFLENCYFTIVSLFCRHLVYFSKTYLDSSKHVCHCWNVLLDGRVLRGGLGASVEVRERGLVLVVLHFVAQ